MKIKKDRQTQLVFLPKTFYCCCCFSVLCGPQNTQDMATEQHNFDGRESKEL